MSGSASPRANTEVESEAEEWLPKAVPCKKDDGQNFNQSDYRMGALALVAVAPWIGTFLFGYDIGATPYIMRQMTAGRSSGYKCGWTIAASAWLLWCAANLNFVGAATSSGIVALVPHSWLGRRNLMMTAAALYILGGILEALEWRLWLFLVGRFVYGLGCGLAWNAAMVYQTETLPSEIRGRLALGTEVSAALGTLCGFAVGSSLSASKGGWQLTYFSAVAVALLYCKASFSAPESARWLVSTAQIAQARSVLAALYAQPSDAVHALDKLVASRRTVQDMPVRLALGLAVLQQLPGRLSSPRMPIAITKIVIGCYASWKVDTSRRRLLLLGTAGTAISALYLALSLPGNELSSLDDGPGSSSSSVANIDPLVLGGVLGMVAGYQVGPGSVARLVLAEVACDDTRAKYVALASHVRFLMDLGLAVVLRYVDSFSLILVLWALMSAYAYAWLYKYLPETASFDLDDLRHLLAPRNDGDCDHLPSADDVPDDPPYAGLATPISPDAKPEEDEYLLASPSTVGQNRNPRSTGCADNTSASYEAIAGPTSARSTRPIVQYSL